MKKSLPIDLSPLDIPDGEAIRIREVPSILPISVSPQTVFLWAWVGISGVILPS